MRLARSLLVVAALSGIVPRLAHAQHLPGSNPRPFGNAVYADLAVGDSYEYLGRTVRLAAIDHDGCTIEVDGSRKRLIVARRSLPEVIGGVRIFVADNRNVKKITSDVAAPKVHSALTRDALVCLSDPSKPLLDPHRFTFPISREDGFQWTMEENSHMFAYLAPNRSHEGIDINLHEARGRRLHALVAIEAAVVRWVDVSNRDVHEACFLLESIAEPGTYYIYQHVNRDRVLVSAGQCVARGQPLGYIWGDDRWGHLHFAVVGYGPQPSYNGKYQCLLNVFPMLYELWHGDLASRRRTYQEGDFTFDRPRWVSRNFKRLSRYDDLVGYGWLLGDWGAAGMVESSEQVPGSRPPKPENTYNARLRKTLHRGTPAEATSPADYFDFEVAVDDGIYVVSARIGDQFSPSWQKVVLEGVEAGTYQLETNRFAWTTETTVTVRDGKLTVRIELRDAETYAGLSELRFRKASPKATSNLGEDARSVVVTVKGTKASRCAAFRTRTSRRMATERITATSVSPEDGRIQYTAPSRSATTFYAVDAGHGKTVHERHCERLSEEHEMIFELKGDTRCATGDYPGEYDAPQPFCSSWPPALMRRLRKPAL